MASSTAVGILKKCTLCKESVGNGGNGDDGSKSLLKDFCKVVLEVSLSDLNCGKVLNLCGGCKDKVNSVLDTKKRMEVLRGKAQELEGALALELLELQGTAGVMISQLGKIKLAMMKDSAGNGNTGVWKPLRKSTNQTACLKDEVAEKLVYLQDWIGEKKSLVPGTYQQLTDKSYVSGGNTANSNAVTNKVKIEKTEPKIEPGEVIMIDSEEDEVESHGNGRLSVEPETLLSSDSPPESPIMEVASNPENEVDMEEEEEVVQQRKRRRCDDVQISAEEETFEEEESSDSDSSFSSDDDELLGRPLTRRLKTFGIPGLLACRSTASGESNVFLLNQSVPMEQSRRMWMERIVKPGRDSNDIAGPTIYLNAVFNWLSVKDQKNFRLVCKQWMEETLENWRITGGTVAFRVGRTLFGENREPIDFDRLFFEQEKILFKFEAVPFHHFKILCDGELFPCYGENVPPRVEFMMRKFGPHMETLVVDIRTSFPVGQVLQGIKWILLKGCKNLKELSILHLVRLTNARECDSDDEEDPEYDQLAHAAQLQSLSICFQESFFRAGVTVKEFCSALVNLVPNIKKLSVSAITEEEFEAIGKFLKQLTREHSHVPYNLFG